jgi:hypothetical protein
MKPEYTWFCAFQDFAETHPNNPVVQAVLETHYVTHLWDMDWEYCVKLATKIEHAPA